jgi:type IV pilus assembly protein PilV
MKQGNSLKTQRGMMLLEGLIAILIFSLGILAVVGMQSASVRHTTDAKHRLDASFLANQSIGMMWVDRNNLANYVVTDEAVAGLPNGKRTIAVNGNQVTVTLTWQAPGESAAHRYAIVALING